MIYGNSNQPVKSEIIMRSILLFLFSVLAINVYAQTGIASTNTPINSYSQLNDSLPQVIYKNNAGSHQNIAWFLNDRQVGEAITKTLNPNGIASVTVSKKALEINKTRYGGQVTITMKEGYFPNLITLNDLKAKYTNLKDSTVLFMFENDIIRSDYDKYMVDENYLLQIVVDKVELKAEKMDFHIVKLLTRSEENVRKVKEIRIR